MKKASFIFSLVVVLSLFVANVSCTLSFGDDEEEAKTGTLSLKITSLIKSNPAPSSNRAILKADKISLTLISNNGAEEDLSDKLLQNTKSKAWTAKINVKSASGYKVRVKIFNEANGENPVGKGESEVFDVPAGKTAKVSVTCIPVETVKIDLNSEVKETLIAEKEFWYSFVASSTQTEIQLKKENPVQSDNGKIYIAIFDKKGSLCEKASANSKAEGSYNTNTSNQPPKMLVKTTSGATYYIGIIKTGGSEHKLNISLKVSADGESASDDKGAIDITIN